MEKSTFLYSNAVEDCYTKEKEFIAFLNDYEPKTYLEPGQPRESTSSYFKYVKCGNTQYYYDKNLKSRYKMTPIEVKYIDATPELQAAWLDAKNCSGEYSHKTGIYPSYGNLYIDLFDGNIENSHRDPGSIGGYCNHDLEKVGKNMIFTKKIS